MRGMSTWAPSGTEFTYSRGRRGAASRSRRHRGGHFCRLRLRHSPRRSLAHGRAPDSEPRAHSGRPLPPRTGRERAQTAVPETAVANGPRPQAVARAPAPLNGCQGETRARSHRSPPPAPAPTRPHPTAGAPGTERTAAFSWYVGGSEKSLWAEDGNRRRERAA